jgi:uncharacterized protein (DUF1499 family)
MLFFTQRPSAGINLANPMKKALKILLLLIIALPLLILIAGQAGLLHGNRPADLGAKNGQLKPPGANSQNVVSSQSKLHPHTAYHEIAPLNDSGEPGPAMAKLEKVIRAMEGANVIAAGPDYLYAEFQTHYLKFIDDVEFFVDASSHEIHMRSASRLGRKDFGANRTRLEQVRQGFARP